MAVTSVALTKGSAAAAVAAGILFIGVQVGHPDLNATSVTTTNVYVRDQLKIVMAVLGLIGVSGLYLSQVTRNGFLGLIGYVVLGAFYLLTMCGVYAAAYVIPQVAESSRDFVSDLIATDTGRGNVEGDIGALHTIIQLRAVAFLAGGLLFGIALYRAHVLARWACALLAVSGFVSVALSFMPDAFYRLLAVPNGIAMIGLGYSLWRTASVDAAPEQSAEAGSGSQRGPRAQNEDAGHHPKLRGARP